MLDYYAQNLAKRSIISAPNLQAIIYFRSQTDLTVEEARQALDSVLALNGIAIIPMGDKFLKVVQIATAKQEGLPFGGEGRAQPSADTLMTQVISLKFTEATDVVGALQPFVHAYGQLIPLPKSSAILLSETAANVNQMLEIVKYIDVPSALRMETKVVILAHAKAAEVAQRLQAIIQETQQIGARASAPGATPQPGGVRPVVRPGVPSNPTAAVGGSEESVVEGKVIITSDERTNKMFILTRPSNFKFFDEIIAELDAKVEPDVIVKVISLDYASAEEAASLINSLISGGSPTTSSPKRTTSSTGTATTRAAVPPPPVSSGSSGGAGAADIGLLEFAQGVRILPDPRTNSLLVMATKEDFARIESMVRSVDTAVAQVLVEVVIAEVKLDGTLDVGVEAFKRLFNSGQMVGTGGFSTGQPQSPSTLPNLSGLSGFLGSNAIPTAAALASGPGGLTYFTSFRNLGLDAVIHLVATSTKFKVLSTPIIQTMDNQEASILVGESRPVITSTVSDISGAVVNNQVGTAVRSNVEFKDIAIELKVTPRINPDGYVTMDIEQKVNDVGGNITVNGTEVPIITKREAKTSVAVQDQSTIVLGGLIREDKTITETRVPFFGDIPFLGTLFKGKSTTKNRTELIVFIRPTVMRGDLAASSEAHRRARLLKAGQELELEKRFESPAAGAPAAALTNALPAKVDDRHAAKVKALDELTQPAQ